MHLQLERLRVFARRFHGKEETSVYMDERSPSYLNLVQYNFMRHILLLIIFPFVLILYFIKLIYLSPVVKMCYFLCVCFAYIKICLLVRFRTSSADFIDKRLMFVINYIMGLAAGG